ncbi:MAG TPA: TonB family protein [Bryobacteraceae bacterium]|jgi:protein TonB
MFEQAVLPARPLTRRYRSIVIAISGEVLLISCLLVGPMISPQLLPRAEFRTWLTVPAPPAASKPLPIVHMRRSLKPFELPRPVLVTPSVVPAKILITEDPPLPPPGFESSVTGTAGPGDLSHIPLGLLKQAMRPLRISPAEPPIAPSPAASLPAKPRIKVGGEVQMARLIKRVEPVYPALARQARISGTVELTGIIGTDGRIKELRVLRGHPLLAKAALDAVRQWIYEATLLNGEPVEVIAPITVTFRLN